MIRLDPTKWEKATWVTTDNDNNILVSGTFMSGYSNPVNAASILMKFSPTGNLLWRQVFESSFDGSYTKKCLVDASNNIYVLGMGSGPAGYVTKIKKFSSTGSALWSYFDADGIGAPINFKFTPDGSIVIACRSIYGSINGYAKIDLNGNKIWSYPGVYSLTVGDASGDLFGNTYLVHGEYVTDPGTVLKKVDQSGNLIWENVYALSGFRVEVGTDDCAVISGYPNQGTPGAAFIKVNESGGLLWTNLDADGPLALMLHARMLLDEYNDAYLAAGTLFEMAVCKVNNDGSSAWTQTLPGSYANDIALGNDGYSIFVVGLNTARLIWNSSTNLPPYEPSTPNPAHDATDVDINIDLSWTGGDPDDDSVTYDVYFGTSSTPPKVVGNQSGSSYNPGTMSYGTLYYWKIVAWDDKGFQASGPIWDFTTENITNTAPNTPIITGQAQGKPGQTYDYRFVATDEDSDDLFYFVDWDDNTSTEWIGPFTSGEEVLLSHMWDVKGTYLVQVKAKDVNGAESDWGILQLVIPTEYKISLYTLLQHLFETFPHLFPALRLLFVSYDHY